MVDRYHTGVFGDSGGGKTSLAREIFHKADGVTLWVDHNGEKGLTSNRAKTLRGLRKLRERNGPDASLVLGRGVDTSDMELAATAIQFCRSHGRVFGEGVRVIFDEAHHFMPDGASDPSKNPVAWAIHEGRDMGIAATIMSQTPRQLEYQPMYNLKYWVWVGPPAGLHDSFLSHSIASWIPQDKLPDERFEYVVMDNRGNVVLEGETSEDYA